MNENIIISIIIVNYNSFALLQSCLESIINNSRDINYEIIVVDNNSTDGDVETITSQYNNIILVKNSTNEGFAKANNEGVQIASGKYLLILNNDTLFVENTIKKIFDFAESIKKPTIIGCKLINEDHSHQNSAYKFPSLMQHFVATFFLDKIFPQLGGINKYYINIEEKDDPIIVDSVIGAFIFISKETFNKLHGFDEKFFFYHEDTDLCFRIKKNGGAVYYFSGTSILHYGGSTTGNNLWFSMKNRFISRIQFAQKHFKSLDKILFVMIEYIGIITRIPLFFLTGIILFNKNYLKRSVLSLRLLFIYPNNKFKLVNR